MEKIYEDVPRADGSEVQGSVMQAETSFVGAQEGDFLFLFNEMYKMRGIDRLNAHNRIITHYPATQHPLPPHCLIGEINQN